MSFLNVACVCVGTGYSPEYVEILYSMVRRNLAGGLRGRFTVFTDDPSAFTSMAGVQVRLVPPDLKGWWAKVFMFSAGAFPKGERVLYFDLDTVITGPLDAIAAYTGDFAILKDAYRPGGLQSSVMAWEAGKHTRLWDKWVELGKPEVDGGDQAWLETMLDTCDLWQNINPGLFCSYKVDCTKSVPKGCSVVFFHGFPRPHQCKGWVKDVWKITDETFFFSLNVKEDAVRANIRHALTKPKWIERRDGTQYPAIIVGGGPSLANDLWRIRGHQLAGGVVFATNNTYKFLKDAGITPNAHVIHDAREANVEFVPDDETICYYASQCHPRVLDAAAERLVCWHPHTDTCIDVAADWFAHSDSGITTVAGGSAVGLNAMALAYILGHRYFLLFGFDSSYTDGLHHAYSQRLNDEELTVDVTAYGQVFQCAPWMVQQAEQFMELSNRLISYGCQIGVHGYGLIPTLAKHVEPSITAADLRAKSLLDWLAETDNPVGAEIGVFAGELSQRLLRRPDLTLYLVDSWSTAHPEAYKASGDYHAALPAEMQEHWFQVTQQVTKFAEKRAHILRKDSREAAKDIPDGSLDFVFIDADHTYEGCKADIEAWLPKIRKGGFLSGHDYENTDFPAWGVKKAVDERFGVPEKGLNFTWRVQV
jgi:hypothetical protein